MKCDAYVMKLVPRTIMTIIIGIRRNVDLERRRRRNVPIVIEMDIIDVVVSIIIVMEDGVRIAYRRRVVNRHEDIVHLLKEEIEDR